MSVLCQLISPCNTGLLPHSSQSLFRLLQSYMYLCYPPFPICPNVALWFVAHLANTGLSHASIISYLCGLWFAQIAAGFLDPQLLACPQLSYVLRGIRRSGVPSVRCRLPITRSFWAHCIMYGLSQDHSAFTIALCLGRPAA